MTRANDSPLSDADARQMEAWVVAANAWGEASQTLVGAAAGLATASRDLSDQLDEAHSAPVGAPERVDEVSEDDDRVAMAVSLRVLADAVERETRDLREEYLVTAANLEQYQGLLD